MNKIRFESMDPKDARRGEVLRDEIKGAQIFFHSLKRKETLALPPWGNKVHIFILTQGMIQINNHVLRDRGIAAFMPHERILLMAEEPSQLLEIRWKLPGDKDMDVKELPYFLNYSDAEQYKEDCKSEKTINRFLLRQRVIPGIAIGSVETCGEDRIEKHEHPYVDQLFFTFSENDMQVLIDDEIVPIKGNTLLHIPLGSDHGVLVEKKQYAHYVWIDFLVDDRALDYMDNAHRTV